MSLKLIHVKEKKDLFLALEKFVEPYEKFCTTLYEKIILKDENIYAILDNRVYGVFLLSKGDSFICCIPKWTKEIKQIVSNFLEDKKVLCVHGEESEVLKIEKILKQNYERKECRNMFLMEYDGKRFIDDEESKTFVCSLEDSKKLMPLQLGFSKEEVLPVWKDLNPPVEKKNLDKSLINNTVYALGIGNSIYSKANINMFSNNIVQISGVYTNPDFRGKGYAAILVNKIALITEKIGRKATLLVRQENLSAYKAYKKAGFGITGTYRIVYFDYN